MKEIEDILRAYDIAEKKGLRTALATVVHVDGSSYRRPGARMLITEEGELTGAISGGCLEGDALRKALQVIINQKARLVTYDTNDEDDAKLGLGLGCNGIIQVLIQPVDPLIADNPITLFRKIGSKRQKSVLVTLFSLYDKKDAQPGTCLLVGEDGSISGTSSFPIGILLDEAKEVMITEVSAFRNFVSEKMNITAFVEIIQPVISMVISGSGNDIIPLLEMAGILGWQTVLLNQKPGFARQKILNGSCQLLTTQPQNIFDHLLIDDHTVFLLMTHNYNHDLALLRELIKKNVRYIGMLGPRKKLHMMLDELEENGPKLTDEQLYVIHSPVGLDIGAETSEEIALSILAEIKSVLANRGATRLKNNEEVIHDRSATIIYERRMTGYNQ
jgi:xanthine dehydrogenase accessory factor